MEELQLSETSRRYFSDLFLLCDEENAGKASVLKTIELIRSANVPEHIIDEIWEIICNNQSLDSLNKKQFFSALKLVAAHQSNRSLSSELITANIDLPLPKFTWNILGSESPIPDLIELSNDLNEYREHIDTTSTDSEFDSDTLSQNRTGSPEVSSATSDSPTPTNSVQDRNWAGRGWQGLISEEQRQLLGTEEELSDKHSSEDETEVLDEVWTITPEQCTYYINQFKRLQPDLKALLPGPVARTFFEKSRLPVHTLRKIWQLADVTKDGALSLQEFMTAMHLVVLKRNHIEIPDILPPGLVPGNNEHPKSPIPEAEAIISPAVPAPSKDVTSAKEWTRFVESPTNSISSPGPKPVNFDFQKVSLDKDPKILHPKPLRLTPENPSANEESRDISDGPSPKLFPDSNSLAVGHNLNLSNVNSQTQNSAIQRPQPKKIVGKGAIPPPPTNQSSIEEGPVSLPAFPPPKKDKPPPPPPRSFKTHGRSSSLDLNRLTKVPVVPPRVSPSINSSKKLINQRSEGDQAAAAAVIDNQEPEASFANFEQFEKYENVQEGVFPGSVYEAERKKLFAQFSMPEGSEEAGPRRHGAFEVYRKPIKGKDSPMSSEEKLKWDAFQKMQEENTVLLRLCQELSQELADTREEKLALKVKLEKLINGG